MRQFPVMLFAAGFGTRMGELTKDRPKPLISVAGKALLDHAVAIVDEVQMTRIVVNLHYLGHQIEQHLAGSMVCLSWEKDVILDTGGGLRAAMPLLGESPVMTMTTDAVWTGKNPLSELQAAWSDEDMDVLFLLAPINDTVGHGSKSDFVLDNSGRVERANGQKGYVFLGAQIIRTDLLAQFPQPAFSLNLVWDMIIARGRAFGVVHSGGWCDVGSPEGIGLAEAMLKLKPHA